MFDVNEVLRIQGVLQQMRQQVDETSATMTALLHRREQALLLITEKQQEVNQIDIELGKITKPLLESNPPGRPPPDRPPPVATPPAPPPSLHTRKSPTPSTITTEKVLAALPPTTETPISVKAVLTSLGSTTESDRRKVYKIIKDLMAKEQVISRQSNDHREGLFHRNNTNPVVEARVFTAPPSLVTTNGQH